MRKIEPLYQQVLEAAFETRRLPSAVDSYFGHRVGLVALHLRTTRALKEEGETPLETLLRLDPLMLQAISTEARELYSTAMKAFIRVFCLG